MMQTSKMLTMVTGLHFKEDAIDFDTMDMMIQKIKEAHELNVDDIRLTRRTVDYFSSGGGVVYSYTYEGDEHHQNETINIDGHKCIDIYGHLVRIQDIAKHLKYTTTTLGD